MKKTIIKFIKRIPFLYKLARFVNKKLNPNKFFKKVEDDNKYICYVLQHIDELEKIQEHFTLLKTDKTRLLVVIKNKKYNLMLHNLIQENKDINFISYDYLEKYNKKIELKNIIFLDYNSQDNVEVVRHFIG